MKHIKLYEKFNTNKNEIYISDVFDYLDVPMFKPFLDVDQNNKLESKYDVDIIEFLKEIFLDKRVQFKSINKLKNNPIVTGRVENVKLFYYQDEVYVQFKIYDDWILVSNDVFVYLPKYDADDKPLHKKVKIAKDAEKYNI